MPLEGDFFLSIINDIIYNFYILSILLSDLEKRQKTEISIILIIISAIFFIFAIPFSIIFNYKSNKDIYYSEPYKTSESLMENLKIIILTSIILGFSILYIPGVLLGGLFGVEMLSIFTGWIHIPLIIYLVKILSDRKKRSHLLKDHDKKVEELYKEVRKNPPLGIKPHHYGYKYQYNPLTGMTDRIPIIRYIPDEKDESVNKINPKTFEKVRLDESFKEDKHIDLNKFKKCPECRRYISIDAKFCPQCGADLKNH